MEYRQKNGKLAVKPISIYITKMPKTIKAPGGQTTKKGSGERLMRPIQDFIKAETSGGILLMFSAIAALALANSALASAYNGFWHTKLTISLGSFHLTKPLILWLDEGLMSLFFLVVGLEIKREIIEGELASIKHAALPIAGAIGGMAVPAIIYALINAGGAGAGGWGIPMATDIAFSLGVLALLGRRVPLALKTFVVALAIVDDIGAVLVIAFFYTSKISLEALLASAIIVAALVIVNKLGIRNPVAYFLLGALLWLALLKSGVHATLAGIILALFIPAASQINTADFIYSKQSLLEKLKPSIMSKSLSHDEFKNTMYELNKLNNNFEAPMNRLERIMLPWVTFAIIPLFALANAGIDVKGSLNDSISSPVTIGILLGLLAGKQLGITGFVWLAVKTGLCKLPDKISWKHIYGASWLCGIGFTMSIFMTNLSFNTNLLLTEAKIGVLMASLVAGFGGWLILRTAKQT